MRRAALLVAGLVVVGAAVPLATGTASLGATAAGSSTQDVAAGNNSTAPGAQLASVVNVQAAEVEGELAQRAFGIQLAAAESNASRAAVLAGQTEALSARLAELRDRKQALVAARENGSISPARFRAEMAGLVAETSTMNRLLNRTSGEVERLPSAVLAEQGVSLETLTQLKEAALNLTGPDVTSIVSDVAGTLNVSVGAGGDVTDRLPGVDGDDGEDGDATDGDVTDGDGDVDGDGEDGEPGETTNTTTTVLPTTTIPNTTVPTTTVLSTVTTGDVPVDTTTTVVSTVTTTVDDPVDATTTVVNVTTNTSLGDVWPRQFAGPLVGL